MWFLQYNIKALAQTRKSLRNFPTPAEEKFWEIVRNKQFLWLKFRRQYSLWRYVMDFYCIEKKLCVEIDGEVHNDENQKEYDLLRTEFLQSAGIKVLRITNDAVMSWKAEEKLREIIF